MSEKMKPFNFLVPPAERKAWEKAAKKEGRTLSSWVRYHCNQAAKP